MTSTKPCGQCHHQCHYLFYYQLRLSLGTCGRLIVFLHGFYQNVVFTTKSSHMKKRFPR